jgi:hypothetical protein
MGWLTNLCAHRSSPGLASGRPIIGGGLLLFAAFSLADFALTWALLERAPGCAHEINPIASWWLAHFGMPGLAGFKGSMVVIVAALALCVARYRPQAARRIVVFGCCTLLAVVLYSGVLVYRVEAVAPTLVRVWESGRNLEQKVHHLRAYRALLDCLQDDLVARRCTLAVAVDRLAASAHVQNPQWLRQAQLCCPGWGLRECLADRLVEHVLLSRQAGAPGSEQFARELNAQFQSTFSRSRLPREASTACRVSSAPVRPGDS